jgi:hypothetical protein
MFADRRSLRRDAVSAGVVCGLASAVAALLLVLVRSGGSAVDAGLDLLPTIAGDTLLALGVIALVRRMLRAETLRAPRPVLTDLALGPRRG